MANYVKGKFGEGFEAAALPHLDALFNFAYRLTRSEKDAEDLVQDTYLRAFRFFDRYEPGTNIKAWLFRIMRNIFINRFHSRRREPETVDFGKIEETYEKVISDGFRVMSRDAEAAMLDASLGAEVEKAMEALPADYRAVVVMALVEEMSYREIAQVLSIPIGTVMSRLHRGRRLLQKSLAEHVTGRARAGTARGATRPVEREHPLPDAGGGEGAL